MSRPKKWSLGSPPLSDFSQWDEEGQVSQFANVHHDKRLVRQLLLHSKGWKEAGGWTVIRLTLDAVDSSNLGLDEWVALLKELPYPINQVAAVCIRI